MCNQSYHQIQQGVLELSVLFRLGIENIGYVCHTALDFYLLSSSAMSHAVKIY